MPSKILLISVNRCTTPYVVFPLGLAHVAGALRRAGHTVEIIDCAINGDAIEKTIGSFCPDFIGLSLRNIDDIRIRNTHFFAGELGALSKKIRSLCTTPIIVGGSGFSLFPEELLCETGADFGIKGEGEESLVRLLDDLEQHRPFGHIPGLVYRNHTTIMVNGPKPCDRSSISPPAHPDALVRFYLDKSTMLNVQTQRGCAYACCYCTYPLLEGATVRPRDHTEICEELAHIKKLGAEYFFIVDSVFNSSQAHVTGFCEELLRRNLALSWGCFLRPQGLTRELLCLMAQAGLRHIEFGSDSFCDSVLDAYGKKFTFEDIFNASEYARAAKVHFAHFLITGGPGETEETLKKGFENSKRLKKTVHFPFVGMRVYPGTPLYKQALREHALPKDTDLLPPFFYISPGLTEKKIFSLLDLFSKESHNWIVGELPQEKAKVVMQLRKIGVKGPMWEFMVR